MPYTSKEIIDRHTDPELFLELLDSLLKIEDKLENKEKECSHYYALLSKIATVIENKEYEQLDSFKEELQQVLGLFYPSKKTP